MPHRVVIIGAGFGGLNAAKHLKGAPVDVVVVDRHNYHLFQPLLYQVATGGLSPADIASPIRGVLHDNPRAEVLLAEANGIDTARRRLLLRDGEISYDSLVVATGSEPSYFGHSDWERLAPPLKSIDDATQMRKRMLLAFEAAEREPDPERRRQWLTFVIVGAGPTGAELAGALAEIANDTLKSDFRAIDPRESRIFLIEHAPRVMPAMPDDLSRKAEGQLVRLGVRPMLGYMVSGIDEEGVTLQHGGQTERLSAKTVLWAAGVRSSPLGKVVAEATGAELERGGRVRVNPDLSVPGHPDLFVIGDLAYLEQDGSALPGLAPVAIQQGRYVAKVIRSRAEGKPVPGPFRYFDKGNLAVIGRGRAVGMIRRLHVHGFVAWLLWLFVHLMYLVGFENRLLVMIQWGFQYVTFGRKARLITGEIPFAPRSKELERPERAA